MSSLFQYHLESRQDHVPTEQSAVEWSTPREFFAPLDEEFGFTVDVCASAGNAKCARFYTRSDDGLQQDWAGEVAWMNPPYARGVIDKWMRKAFESSQSGATVVCLVPSSTSTNWWHDYAMKGDVRFVRGRIRFGGSSAPAMFANAVVIFRPATKNISE